MNLPEERTKKIFLTLGGILVRFSTAEDLVAIFCGNKSWSELRNMEGVVQEIVEEVIKDDDPENALTEDEFTEIVRPLLAGKLAESIGAKEVTIVW
jgi:hypothetical protein